MRIWDLRFVICLGFWIWCSGVAQGGELRFRFQPGDKFYLTSTVERKVTRVVDDNEQAAEQAVRLGYDLDIEEVSEDGNAWARFTYRKAAMKIKGPGVDVAFDSEAYAAPPGPGAPGPKSEGDSARTQTPAKVPSTGPQRRTNLPTVPPEALPLALALGEKFYAKITPQGRIDRINGLQAIANYARGRIRNIQGKEQIIQAIERRFDEAAVKKELEEQLAVFPPSAVPGPDANLAPQRDVCEPVIEVGDTWCRSGQIDENSTDAPVAKEQTFQLKERRPGGIAVVDVNLVVRPTGNIQEITVGNAKAKREVRGRGSGQIEIEESNGRIINSTLTQDLVEEIKLLPQGMMLRLPPNPEPTRWHIVTSFQMTKREDPNTK
jgi:hypothetical protein